jgi:RHS repeat-associated protein
MPVVTYGYDQYGDQTSKTETYGTGTGQVVRTTTTGYDAAGRVTSGAVSVAPAAAGGTALPAVSYGYDPATGLPTTTSTGSGSSQATLTTGYNSIGEQTSYTDATGTISTTTYDLDGRVASVDDGKGTTTYSYDTAGEHRGLVTGEDIGVSGAPSTFTATYDAGGDPARLTYPNGLTVSRGYDNTGALTGLVYVKAGAPWMSFTQTVNPFGQIATQTSPQSSQSFGYDPDQRLSTVLDTYQGACTTRVYGFDTHSNRTSLKTYPAAGDGSCTTGSTPTTVSTSFDQADRDTSAGYTYDALGRTSTVPAADAHGAGSHASTTGDLTVGYDANDMVASQHQGTATISFTLDPDQNRILSSSDGTTTSTNHYSDDTDSPTWTTTGTSTWTRNITGPDGNLAATAAQDSTVTLQLANPHGDIVATAADTTTATSISSYSESTEYGAPRNPATAYDAYGWLGAKQRSTNDLASLTLMGVRLYNPATARFLSTDPVPGGNNNTYTYPNDPINNYDTTGQCGLWGHNTCWHHVTHAAKRAWHAVKHRISWGRISGLIASWGFGLGCWAIVGTVTEGNGLFYGRVACFALRRGVTWGWKKMARY